MIEIEEPPEIHIHACGSCMKPLRWMRSWDTGLTFSVVVDEEDRETFHLHRCRPLQSPPTWRQLQTADPPSAEYLAAKAALGKTSTDPAPEEAS